MSAAAEVLVLTPTPRFDPAPAHAEVWGQCLCQGAHVHGEAVYYFRGVGGIRLDLDVDLLTDTFAVELRGAEGRTIFAVARTHELAGPAVSSTLALGDIEPQRFPALLEGALEAIRLLVDGVAVECASDRLRVIEAASRVQRAVIRSAAGNLMAIDDDAWESESEATDASPSRRVAALVRLGRA